jgi:hypothetical protein
MQCASSPKEKNTNSPETTTRVLGRKSRRFRKRHEEAGEKTGREWGRGKSRSDRCLFVQTTMIVKLLLWKVRFVQEFFGELFL